MPSGGGWVSGSPYSTSYLCPQPSAARYQAQPVAQPIAANPTEQQANPIAQPIAQPIEQPKATEEAQQIAHTKSIKGKSLTFRASFERSIS